MLLVAAVWLYLFPYRASLNNPNERTRVLQARALAEKGQLSIGESFAMGRGYGVRDLYGRVYRGAFVNDVALVCKDKKKKPPRCEGPIYPAKAPGATLLGAPALFVANTVGLVPEGQAGERRATWIVRFGGVAPFVLSGLLALALLLGLAGVASPLRARVVLAAGLGTGVFPYGITAVGHAAAGAALLWAVYLLARARLAERGAYWRVVLGGGAAGAAVLFEYHAVFAAVVVGVWAVLDDHRRRLFPGFVLGAAAMAGLHLTLHHLMFGRPWETGHLHLMTAHNRAGQASGFLGIDGLHWGSLRDHLVDSYMGLLPIMPWLAAGGLAGLVFVIVGRSGKLGRGAAAALLAIVVVYLLFVSSLGNWRTMNGWSIGPRYLLPATLPLCALAGLGWARLAAVQPTLGRVIAGLAAASVVVVSAVTAVFPSPPPSALHPFAELAVPLLAEGVCTSNAGLLLGLKEASLAPLLPLVLVAALWVALGRDEPRRRAGMPVLVALLVAATVIAGLASWRPTPKPALDKAQAFVRSHAECPPP
jgi:hypothetical protein